MKQLIFASLVVLGVGGIAQAVSHEPRVALVIGNSAYRDTPLANPANDARLMAATLREVGFEVVELVDADQKTMKVAILEFGDRLEGAGPEAVGLFYYAGHGLQVGAQNFLIPLHSAIQREKDVAVEAVSAAWVLGQMEFAENRVNFVILDACRNNPLVRSFRSPTRGLARMDAPRGSLIAYSTAPGKVSADGVGANSPYSLALSQALRTPGVAAEKVFKLVRDSVMAATKGNQTPWEESSLTGSDFYFAVDVPAALEAPEAPATAEADTSATVEQETVFWQSVEDSTDPADFDAYLAEYPTGRFAALARNRLRKLSESRMAAVIAPRSPAAPAAVEPSVGAYPVPTRGTSFKDCETCPEMIAVPPGSFVMGTPADETRRRDDEGPQHRVTVPSFAIGKYEVTFAEWDACVAEGGCKGYRPFDWNWGRGRRPVINVSWDDAHEYVAWLSGKTGKRYRLPSEAEWEYVARSGTETPFHLGSTIGPGQANYNGDTAYAGGPTGVSRERTVSVGSFRPNDIGIHDVHGNVSEWVEDCSHGGYASAPDDGGVWTTGGDCLLRGLRGGSWKSTPDEVRSGMRHWYYPSIGTLFIGFRVARTLP